MRNDITFFTQCDSESLYEAYERFKELLRKCPYHDLPKWLQVQTFYSGMMGQIRTIIDAATSGSFMGRSLDEAYELLEEMASNNDHWSTKEVCQEKL